MTASPPTPLFQGNARDGLPACAPDGVWILQDGSCDLFLVSGTPGQDDFHQRLLCTIEAGAMVMPCAGHGVRFEAVPLSGARVEAVPRHALTAADWEEALAPWWRGIVDGLERLGLSRPQVSWIVDGLLGDDPVAANAAFSVREGLVWLEAEAERPRPLSMVPELPGLPVPITHEMWCLATGEGRLGVLTTAQVMERGQLPAAVDMINCLLVELARDLMAARQAADEHRLEQRWTREAQTFDHLMAAAVESLDGQRLAQLGAEESPPLLRACRRVAQWHGIAIPDDATDDALESMDQRVRRLALNHRFQTRRVVLDPGWWREDNPALLAFDHASGEPVAIIPSGGVALVFDGKTPQGRRLDATLAAGLATHAYTFHTPFPEGAKSLPHLARFGLSGDVSVFPLVLMALATGLLGVLPPMVIKILFESAIPSSDFALILDLAAALLVIHLTTIAVTMAFEASLVRMEGKSVARMQSALFDRVLRLPAGFLLKMPLGKIHSKWMIFEKLHASAIGRVFITATLTCLLSVFSLVIMFALFPTSAILVLVLTLILLGFAAKVGKWQLADMGKGRMMDGHYWSVVTETLRGIRKVRLAGAEGRMFNRWFEFLVERRVRFLQGLKHRNRLNMVMATYEGAILLIILLVFSFEYQGHALPMGHFMAFLAATRTFTHAVAVFAAALPDFSLTLRDDLPDALPFLNGEIENPAGKKPPGLLQGGIELSKLSFRYEGSSRPVLDAVSIEAQKGEFVALVGPSGCGKSTVLKLLLGIETPSSGAVFYDGRNLNQMDVIAVRNQIGVVMQNANLLPGTVFDYISANRSLTLAEAWEAARLAGIDDVIGSLPMGMFTFISESGSTLSGGQMQRLMIARALSGKPKLLLFDEATSWLDNITQQKIVETLSRLQITRIIIAHRLSTVRQADRIYVLDQGRIAETGTFDDLRQRGGLFNDLVKRQLI